MKISLDTNAYTRLVQHHVSIIEIINESDEVLISTIVLGELFAGFQLGTRYSQNVNELYQFLDLPNINIVTINTAIAEQYGNLVKLLRTQGTPVPSNDIWIAASAIETNSTLITYDKHFSVIPGITILSV